MRVLNMKETYNGWTNYETWRVNLEIFDSLTPADFWGFEEVKEGDSYEFSKALKDYAEEIICEQSQQGIAQDYALAFISNVDWYSIAKHMIKSFIEA
jgi:hypothetical protein